jgi:D-alanyl-D-alanine carboxypeptidase
MPARFALLTVAAATAVLAPAAMAGPALLFDATDNKVLYAEDQDHQWHPASLTKIMTAYVVFEAIKEGKVTLEQKIGCSAEAASQPPSKIGLAVGAQMSVDTALKTLIIKSANDVAVMLAEAVAGSHDAFVEKMNATATRLGMSRTKFANANGLPAPEQVSTARDLAKLSAAVVRDYPDHAHMWSMVDVRVGRKRIRTHNGLLVNYAGADGMKTGFICDSGFNLVASATRDGHKMIAVVLGETTGGGRSVRAANLLEHGFQTHKWAALFPSQNLESLPLADDAKGPTTIRQSVISWVCGTARRALSKYRRKKGKSGVIAVKAQEGETVAKPQKKAPAKSKAKSG